MWRPFCSNIAYDEVIQKFQIHVCVLLLNVWIQYPVLSYAYTYGRDSSIVKTFSENALPRGLFGE